MFLMLKKNVFAWSHLKKPEWEVGIHKTFRNVSDLSNQYYGHLTYLAPIGMPSATSHKEPISKWLKPGPVSEPIKSDSLWAQPKHLNLKLSAILRKSQGWEIKTLANHVLDYVHKAMEGRGLSKAGFYYQGKNDWDGGEWWLMQKEQKEVTKNIEADGLI